MELLLGLACCVPLVLAGGAGIIFVLVKLGVIGSYWLKGEESAQDGGDYTLDQSEDASSE